MFLRLPLLAWLPVAVVCGVVAAVVALQKRRNVGLWFLVGLLLPIVGVAVVSLLPAIPPATPPSTDSAALGGADRGSIASPDSAARYEPRPGTVFCRRCGAPNPEDSTFCRNCGEMLRF